jgi:hypothetical protein
MKKFTKIVEEVSDKKHFKVNAEVELIIPADNQGEAAYKADTIITGMDNLSEYVINKVDETEVVLENKNDSIIYPLIKLESKSFAEWLRHNCVISSSEGYYYDGEIYDINEIYEIYISKK